MNIVVGFVFLLLIGFIASKMMLFRSKLSLGTQYLFLAGTEFLIIGLIAGPLVTDIISKDVLRQLSPVISLGLGWIGLLIGIQFEGKQIAKIPAYIWFMGATISLVSFAFTFLLLFFVCMALIHYTHILNPFTVDPVSGNIGIVVSLCFLLGWVSSVSTYSALALLRRTTDAKGESIQLLQLLTDVRSPIAIVGMGAWYCFNHLSFIEYAPDQSWPLESTLSLDMSASIGQVYVMSGLEWLLFTVLLGISLGWLLHYLSNKRLGENELLLTMTGIVIFSGGLSAYLHLSPLFVNMIMGITFANLPNFAKGRITNWLLGTEQPFFVIFMILVGTMWPPVSPSMLLLTSVYIVARLFGLGFGGWLASYWRSDGTAPSYKRLGLAMIPQGGLALALAFDFSLIHPGAAAEFAIGIVIVSTFIQQLIGPNIMISVLRRYGAIEINGKTVLRKPAVNMEQPI